MNRLPFLQQKLKIQNKQIVSIFGIGPRTLLRKRAQKTEEGAEFIIACLESVLKNEPVDIDHLMECKKTRALVIAVKSALSGEPVNLEELKANVVQE